MTPVDTISYRRTVGRFATGVTVLSTVADGVQHGLTANSFSSVSLEPPLVLVCVEKEARFHAAVLGAGLWGVSVLADDQEDLSRRFARRGRVLAEQFDEVEHVTGRHTGAALVAGALAHIEVRTVSAVDAGDHTVLLGEVLELGTTRADARPLVYFESSYVTVER